MKKKKNSTHPQNFENLQIFHQVEPKKKIILQKLYFLQEIFLIFGTLTVT